MPGTRCSALNAEAPAEEALPGSVEAVFTALKFLGLSEPLSSSPPPRRALVLLGCACSPWRKCDREIQWLHGSFCALVTG